MRGLATKAGMALVGWVMLMGLTGCQTHQAGPDYARPLPPGAHALRKLPPEQWPDFSAAFASRDQALLQAADRSIAWFEKPSTRQFFPSGPVSHEQAQASVWQLRELIARADSLETFEALLRDRFDVYQSVGWDDQGTVLFTGYYSPIITASAVQTPEYRYPLYTRPGDLVSDPRTGKVLGRQVGNVVVQYPRRREIERSRMLAGSELVWMRDPFENFVVHVNGSARLRMTDGSTLHVGYAGHNGHEYVSVAKQMIADGRLREDQLSLRAMRDHFQRHPEDVDRYLLRNDRFVFFQVYDGSNWPAGSLGFKVTPMRTLATDKQVFPRGCMTLVVTRSSAGNQADGRWSQFMLDQDTGGAIRAPGRGDLYMGVGSQAEMLAGHQYAEGQLYYLILKPRYVPAAVAQMRGRF